MRLYIIAMQFLTIIPLPFNLSWEKDGLGRSLAVFPLAGLTIGVVLVGVDRLLTPVVSRPLEDALLITLLAVMTGALHLDGLADVCDGIAARGSRERFLEIMKDSRVGAVGVVGLVLGLLLKWQALAAVPQVTKWQALLLFPTIARFGQVQTIVFAKNARSDGLGATFITAAGPSRLLIAGALTLAAAWALLEIRGLLILASVLLATWLFKAWFHRKLGGITGDVVGCISELNEILVLLLIPVLAKF